jgi:phosphoribosyl-ATP pyrophosphohydrolase
MSEKRRGAPEARPGPKKRRGAPKARPGPKKRRGAPPDRGPGQAPARPGLEDNNFTLADLAAIVAERARSGGPGSYTAKLVGAGVERCAKKFGEEAVEAALAAVAGSEAALTAEAADVLYHLLVMLAARGITLAAVMAELKRRTAESGLAEKAARRAGDV